jgi:hypothetical protein
VAEPMKVSPAFARAFARVHAAFGTAPAEIDEAKAAARANMVAAQDGYYATAAMVEAGWDPKREQAATFVQRTGFTLEARWPVKPPEQVDIQWPEKPRRAA